MRQYKMIRGNGYRLVKSETVHTNNGTIICNEYKRTIISRMLAWLNLI